MTEACRTEALLEPVVLTSADELIKAIRTGGSLGRSNPALVEFVISRSVSLVRSKVKTLNFVRANFQLFKEMVKEIPWETVLKGRHADQSWQLFRATFLTVQELSIPVCRKLSKAGQKLAGLSKDLLLKLTSKKEMHRQ